MNRPKIKRMTKWLMSDEYVEYDWWWGGGWNIDDDDEEEEEEVEEEKGELRE